MSKPVTNSIIAIRPAKVISDRNFSPKPALPGITPRSDPVTVSPNSPPSPKVWVQASPGTSVAQWTAAKATPITAKTTRPMARSLAPMHHEAHAPGHQDQRDRPGALADQDDQRRAPSPPRTARSMFCAGSSVATIQPGSSGE
jgi:hypothetical protein